MLRVKQQKQLAQQKKSDRTDAEWPWAIPEALLSTSKLVLTDPPMEVETQNLQ